MNSSPQTLCTALLKVGGSILDNPEDTIRLSEALVSLGRIERIVVFTGGGKLAKRIKANQRARDSDFMACWHATTLALDANAGLLASHSPMFAVARSMADILQAHDRRRIPIFAPAQALFSSLWFTPNWVATTDTMGLYFGRDMGARRYVIVTDVDGVCPHAPGADKEVEPILKMTVEELEALPSSKLDAAFPIHFRRHPIETFVVNGKVPQRVVDASRGRLPFGTYIPSDSALLRQESATLERYDRDLVEAEPLGSV